jgi:hypothetical protein
LQTAKKPFATKETKIPAYAAERQQASKSTAENPDRNHAAPERTEQNEAAGRTATKSEADTSQQRLDKPASRDESNEASQAAPAPRESTTAGEAEGRTARKSGKAESTETPDETATSATAQAAEPPLVSAVSGGRPALLELVENLRELSKSDESNSFVTNGTVGEEDVAAAEVGLESETRVARLLSALPGTTFFASTVNQQAIATEAPSLTSRPSDGLRETAGTPESAQVKTSVIATGNFLNSDEVHEEKSLQQRDLGSPEDKEKLPVPVVGFLAAERIADTDRADSSGQEAANFHAERSSISRAATEPATAPPHKTVLRPLLVAQTLPSLPHEVVALQLEGRDASAMGVSDLDIEPDRGTGVFSTGNPQGKIQPSTNANEPSPPPVAPKSLLDGREQAPEKASPAKTQGQEGDQEQLSSGAVPVRAAAEAGGQQEGSASGSDSRPPRRESDARPLPVSQGPAPTAGNPGQTAERGDVAATASKDTTSSTAADRLQSVERLVDLASLQK